MATCLQLPMASSYSIASSTSFLTSSKNRVSSIKTRFIINAVSDPNESFIKQLSSFGPDEYLQRRTRRQRHLGSDTLPMLDAFDSPNCMATDAQMARHAASYNDGQSWNRNAPDLASHLFDGRVVFIGMPLVPIVSELVIAELLYLQWVDTVAPIYIYINSTGTTTADGETVAMETDGFAIYDVMMLMTNELYTLGLGYAIGQACLLLAAGAKGKRFMMPHAQAMIHQPRLPPTRLMPASDVAIRAKEIILSRDTLVTLLAKHTGNSEETVLHVLNEGYYMDATEAKDFGVIDRILLPPKKKNPKTIAGVASPKD